MVAPQHRLPGSGFHCMRYRKYGSQVYTKLEENKLELPILCFMHTRRDAGIQTQIISTDNKPFCLIILLKLTRSHFTDNDTAGSD